MKPKTFLLINLMIYYQCFQLPAQTINKDIFTTNGPVYTTAQKGDTVYLGGAFSQMGYNTKKIVRYLADSTKPDLSFIQLAEDATLNAIEPDGSGGYYLCGRFYSYNGVPFDPVASIIHILSDNSLDANFTPTYVSPNYYDNPGICLKKVGSRLYVGGIFDAVDGVNHKNIAALNATTGRTLSWYPDEPDDKVTAIEATDSLIFLIGDFKNMGEHPADKFAALKTKNGKYSRYYASHPEYYYQDGNITACKIRNNKLYLGGNFKRIGYKSAGLTKVSTVTATADINFPETNGSVNAIIVDGEGGYYIAGNFSLVNNIKRTNLAHILANGTVDPAFNYYLDDYVSCLALNGNNLYFGGAFTRVDNITRRHAAAVLINANTLTPWNPAPDDIVNTMAFSHDTIYMGGNFKIVKGKSRNCAAAVTELNKLTDWDPAPDYAVKKIITALSGNSVFLAGDFSTVKGVYRPSIAKVNNSNGDVSLWSLEIAGSVEDMALRGSKLFIGGGFYFINGAQKLYLAQIDTASGNPTNFDVTPNESVNALAIQNNKLYVGGSFNQMQNISRRYCARIDLTTNTVDDWDPSSSSDISVIIPGASGVVMGGNFQTINDISKNYLAIIDLNTSYLTQFNPQIDNFSVESINAFTFVGKELFAGGNLLYSDDNYSNYYNGIISFDTATGSITRHFDYTPYAVNALTISNNLLYAGGDFNTLTNPEGDSSVTRYKLASYNLSTNKLTNKIYNPNDEVSVLYTDNSQRVIAGGAFSLTNFVDRGSIGAISLATGKTINWQPFVNGEVRAMALKDTLLFIGGYFNEIGNRDFSKSVNRSNLAALSTNRNLPTAWNADVDYIVHTLALKDSTLYVGGSFYTVKGVSRSNAAAVGTGGTGTLRQWAPEPDSRVYSILPAGDKVYLAGEFTHLNGLERYYLGSVNSTTGAATAWNPNPNYYVHTLAANATTLYAGGEFFTISGMPRRAVAAYNLATNKLTSFDPQLTSASLYFFAPELTALATYEKSLFIGSDGFNAPMDSIKGVSRHILGAADTATGNATTFNPVANGTIYHLNIVGNRLFVGGAYTSMAVSPSASYFSIFNLSQAVSPSDFTDKQAVADSTNSAVSMNTNNLNNLKAVLIPNPVKDYAILKLLGNKNNLIITMMDMSGKRLWQSSKQNVQQIQIPVNNLTQGMYFISVSDGKQTSIIRFVKQD